MEDLHEYSPKLEFGAKAESAPLWAGGLSEPRVDGLPSETPEGKQGTKQAKYTQGSGHHGGSLERLSSPTLGC